MMAATPASSNSPGEVERGHLALLGPALDRHLAVAGVDADGDAAGKIAGRLVHQGRVAHCCGAEDHAVDALLQPRDDGVEIANAAAELHRHMHRPEDRLDRLLVHRLAFERAVQIDHMQPIEALVLERAPLRRRIGVEHRRLRHLALAQPHALAVFEVDGGK